MTSMTKYHKKYGGTIELVEIPLEDIIVTRPWIHKEKVNQYRGFSGITKPLGIVETPDGTRYLVDGHHKGSANYLDGHEKGIVQLLTNSDPKLEYLLQKRNQGRLPEFSLNLR